MDNKSVKQLKLIVDNFDQRNSVYMYAKQYDANSRIINIDLRDSTGHINVTGLAQLNCKKPDGTTCYIAGVVNSDGTVSVTLTNNILSAVGEVVCDLTVFSTDESDNPTVLTTNTFYIEVSENILDENAIESTDEFSTISTQMANMALYVQEAVSARNAAVVAKNDAENAAEAAIEAADAAEEALNFIIPAYNDVVDAKNDAIEAASKIENMSVSAIPLSAGSSPTVSKYTAGNRLFIQFGIPQGRDGRDGQDGQDGQDGGSSGAEIQMGNGAPTSATSSDANTFYFDKSANELYVCKQNGNSYSWVKVSASSNAPVGVPFDSITFDALTGYLRITSNGTDVVDPCYIGVGGAGGGSSDVIVLQATGQSPSAVMSQKAVSDALSSIISRLDDLEYVPISIASFTNNANTKEKGSVVTSVTLSFVINKSPTSLSVDGASISPVESGSVTLTGQNITQNRSFLLVATDDNESVQRSTEITFVNGVYYGAAASATINSSFILALTKSLQSSRSKQFSVTAGQDDYIWYACPSAYGDCRFIVGGFDGGFTKVNTISFTNASQYTENYDVYRSDNKNLGTQIINVS